MSAHTPGPWVLEQDGDVYVRLALDNVLRCMDERSDVATSQDYANARLIAAAPDLLEALRATLRCLEWHEQRHGVGMDAKAVKDARAAIAKATGEAL